MKPPRRTAAGAGSRQTRSAALPSATPVGMQLHTLDGARKYLTAGERVSFLREAERAARSVRTLCMTLVYAGCRLSEALALTADRVDLAAGVLVFESLKKRRRGVFRTVPPRRARCTRLGAWHPGDADPTRRAALAVVTDDRLAGGACGDGGGRA